MTDGEHEFVIKGGRVVDPESGHDALADVGIDGTRISAIASGLHGRTVLDAAGLVVAPGFIDLHSHTHSVVGHRLQAHDGVTTALDLEVGSAPVGVAYDNAAREGRPLNYGFSASWAALRMQALAGVPADGHVSTVLQQLGNPAWQRASTAPEQERLLGRLEDELAAGALGVGVIVGYAPDTHPDEYVEVARTAARAGRPVFTHARDLVEVDPQVAIDGAAEIVRAAATTGAHMHYCHVNSTSRRHVERVLRRVEECRAEGGVVTTEAYPYGAGSTAIGAAFLAPELLHRQGLEPQDIVYLPTGERVRDAAHLAELRRADPGGLAVLELLKEDEPADRRMLDAGILSPETMIASDAMPVVHGGDVRLDLGWPPPPGALTHPRTAGCFAKTLRRYVREDAAMDLREFLRRASLLPAQLLEPMSEAMSRKGRLREGADADVVVFDLDSVSDQATYLDPCRTSSGFRHVLVNGTPVIRDGRLDLEARPGRAIRAG